MSAALTRRAALTGAAASLAAAGIAAAAVATPFGSVATSGASPKLAALIAAVQVSKSAVERHQRDVLDRPVVDEDAATVWQQIQDNNDLNFRWVEAIDAVAIFPAATPTDLHAKLAFMVENQMGDGQDWLPELLADAARLAKLEG